MFGICRCLCYETFRARGHWRETVSHDSQNIWIVSPKSVEKLFQEYEYYAKAYYGDINTLKKRLSEGVPVIAFIRIPNDTHYVVIVGYDEQYIYLADSLSENATVSGEWYNRKISTSEFLRVWKTNTLLPGNTYIIAASKVQN